MTQEIDPRLENIIEQMFRRCYNDKCFEQAIGVALDTRRLDKVKETCIEALNYGSESVLEYTFSLCLGARNITSREFRLAVINVLVELYSTLADPDYSNVCYGLQYLNRPADVSNILQKLCKGTLEETLQAYQIAFDLQETENQGFILKVVSNFAELANTSSNNSENTSEEHRMRLQKLQRILMESFDIDLTLNFLFKQSRTDLSVLKSIKTATEGRSNTLHNAVVIAHAYMNSGTTQDTFLRDNLDWLSKASNWSKFSAVASIGVVHKGHVHESMNLLQPYLPQGGQSSSPFSESGALYALGLIHANKGGNGDNATITYLSNAIRNSGENYTVLHGACLGLGLAAMATGDETIYQQLQDSVYQDDAVGGEGAALAIGLLMLGQSESPLAQNVMDDLLRVAHDTQHEKIIRALALSIAMMVYGKEESADVIIETLIRDRDPIIRYGGMFAIAMAYCGTADNGAVKKLLHVAVSDVNDDVRRGAVMSLGFVMFRQAEAVPQLVALLAESYNPHVRYGACMAVGIACAGTALKDALDLLFPLLDDPVDFVKQGACMSLAFVLQQTAEARSPSVKKFRTHLMTVINDKHYPPLSKSGAIIAFGILDAGGRNVVLSMQSKAGFLKMGAAVGVMMFLQHWYWYPLKLMLSLAFQSTALIGLNKDLDVPLTFEVTCNAPPSMFSYPKLEEKKEDEKKLIATAVLSTTAKAKAREARKEARKQGISREATSEGPSLERVTSHLSTASYLSFDELKPTDSTINNDSKKKDKEPSSFTLTNPARVIPSQVRFISLQSTQRYAPVSRRCVNPAGIVVLIDSSPSNPENVLKVERLAIGQEDEADAPEPFEWSPDSA